MIYDKISNLALYKGLNINIEKAVIFLQENNPADIEAGVHEIDGKNLFLIVQEYDTKTTEGKQHEGHDHYIDIQYIYAGKELMKYASRIGGEKVLKTYPVEKDIAKYETKTIEQDVIVDAGYFALFNTQDLHMPCLQVGGKAEPIKKLVFKLKV